MTTISARFRIRGVTTGGGAPADHMGREIAVNESTHSFWYGYGEAVAPAASASHLLFRSNGTRLWHSTIGAVDGSTVFVGDGAGLTGVAAASVAWTAVTGKPTTLAGYGITDGVTTSDSRLSDAREWTATTVSQAEAEAGSATTRRAWTAQRVFQAIAAWWAASAAKTKLDGIASGATVGATWGGNLASIPASIDAIDGLTPAADRLAYYTGGATAALATLTAAARNLLDDADAAAMRTTLGLGTAATTAATAYATAAQGAKADSALQPAVFSSTAPASVALTAADDGWTAEIIATMTPPADPSPLWSYRWQWRIGSGGWRDGGTIAAAGASTGVIRLAPVNAGDSYQVRARAEAGPVVSAWTTSSALVVPAVTRILDGGIS
ncbi:hypothetical protein [Gemmobacter sp.]|uniref:hypothetical protein n=1 Tax=Gemmobacter sp. TaxID=1898957 RepID=UPI002AFF1884|nr:hypothetical protein [Gemmobacter sp.]